MQDLTPDDQHIAAFLASVGEGLHLCSIAPDGGACRGRWFDDDVVAATEWATSENQRERNVYWTVNRISNGFNGKPSKKDIVAARYIHVDIDPPKDGGTFDKLSAEAKLCALSHPPSLIIDSGGGLQAFWRLANLAAPDEVETLNQAVAARLGADHCHNIDRLMRVPGTLNYPNAKKRASGRTVSLAKVIYDADGVLVWNPEGGVSVNAGFASGAARKRPLHRRSH